MLPEGRATRIRVERHRTLLAAAFPDRGWRVRPWLREPSGPLSRMWVLSSTRGRVRRDFLPTRSGSGARLNAQPDPAGEERGSPHQRVTPT
jgi:hypothetical protein